MSTQQKNTLQTKDYLITLQRNPKDPNKLFVPIEFNNYQDIGWTIENLANACINYLHAKENNMLLEDNLFDVIKLLELQKQLIPHSEFELLDKLNE